jgi:hypothetical protein
MTRQANPFKPKNQRKTLFVSVVAGFASAFFVVFVGWVNSYNPILTFLATVFIGFFTSILTWKRF